MDPDQYTTQTHVHRSIEFECKCDGGDWLVVGDAIREDDPEDGTSFYWDDDVEVFGATNRGDMSETPLKDRDLSAWLRDHGASTAEAAWERENERAWEFREP